MKKLLIPVLLFITGGLMMATTYKKMKAPSQGVNPKQVFTDTVHRTIH